MKTYPITEEFLNAMIQYLVNRPHREVDNMIKEIHKQVKESNIDNKQAQEKGVEKLKKQIEDKLVPKKK